MEKRQIPGSCLLIMTPTKVNQGEVVSHLHKVLSSKAIFANSMKVSGYDVVMIARGVRLARPRPGHY